MKTIWYDDEELRTITGYMYNRPYDPICDHVFDYSLNAGGFCPRYGHVGWYDGHDQNPPVLLDNLIEQKRYLNGWERYQLPDPLPPLHTPTSRVHSLRMPGVATALRSNPKVIQPKGIRTPSKRN
jgi:hypothetical protein